MNMLDALGISVKRTLEYKLIIENISIGHGKIY